jgi:hypothetical protein
LGKDKGRGRSSSCKKERSAHARRPKKAFPVNESSLGGKKKSSGKEKRPGPEERRTYTCRSKETFRANEGALGSEKEGRREIATAVGLTSDSC